MFSGPHYLGVRSSILFAIVLTIVFHRLSVLAKRKREIAIASEPLFRLPHLYDESVFVDNDVIFFEKHAENTVVIAARTSFVISM